MLDNVTGIHKIKHVIVIMQENRSFDSYFGHFKGAKGIPKGACVPDPVNGGCVKPFADHKDSNKGGPHMDANALADIDHGKMDGFVKEAELHCHGTPPCPTDVMGFHPASDIPNYTAYAKDFVLADDFYESDHSWSLPAHLFMVSAWSATCSHPKNPMSCKGTDSPRNRSVTHPQPFGWTDLTWLLNRDHVSWGYYLDGGAGSGGVPSIWNPLPGFRDVHKDGQAADVQPLSSFFTQAKSAPAEGLLDRAQASGQRAPAGAGQPRPGLRNQGYQRRHERSGLELQRDLPGLGRLGRLLRQRPAASA